MKAKVITILLVAIGVAIFVPIAFAENVFTETFDSLTSGTVISTSNTNFDYVRIGTGGGSITAEEATNGEIHMRIGGSNSTSLNGVGIQSSLGNLDIVTLNFRMKLEDSLGDVFVGMGDGAMFSGNGGFNTNELMWAIQSDNGNLEQRVGSSWLDIGPTNLSANENYEFHIVANRSGTTVNYGVYSVDTGTMDLFINGVIVGDNLAITNNQNATGFRIYQINGASFARIDSITIDNTALEPFAPTAVSLQSLSATAALPLLLTILPMVGFSAGTVLFFARRRYRTWPPG